MELMDRIFYGTIEELKEGGVKFTMDSLAARLGISKRTLYEQIPSKEALLDMVIEKSFLNVKEKQKEIMEDNSLSAIEKAKQLMCVIPCHSKMQDYRYTDEIEKSYPALYQKVQNYIENNWNMTLNLLNEAMEQGVMKRKNLYLVKETFCALFEKLLEEKFLKQLGGSYEEVMSEMMDMVFEGLLIEKTELLNA